MDIAMIGPTFHNRTQSSDFFINVLAQLGTVHVFWDESWSSRANEWIAQFDPSQFDCIVIWQWSTLLLSKRHILVDHPNVIFVPMYDHTLQTSPTLRHALYSSYKVICFSPSLFDEVARSSTNTTLVRYFPDPDQLEPRGKDLGLAGFLWRRTNQITEATIARLCSNVIFDRFTLHWCPDPIADPIQGLNDRPIRTKQLLRTSWFSLRADYLDTLKQHNLFFAPRRAEGIGMSFLEAMGMGLCVVAPNTPTHNEYIIHGYNGILYSDDISRLDLGQIDILGDIARESIRTGHGDWLNSIDRLCSFMRRG
jgi:glycosyltransferase involved in cell wall biosynthesis